MKDLVKFTGHFKIQSLDKDHNIIDEWEDHNLIMESARTSMAEIFSSVNNASINKLVIGTLGYNVSTTVPKTATEGFVKEREKLFSEYTSYGDETASLKMNDTIQYTGTNNVSGITNEFYIYLGSDNEINLQATDFSNSLLWEDFGSSAPYIYNVKFDLPESNNTDCLNITEYEYYSDPGSPTSLGTTVYLSQTDNSTSFTIDIPAPRGNSDSYAQYTEAALYANNRIFSMKTFRSKIKDSSVQLRIIWTISF